jgi:hypothetical protein
LKNGNFATGELHYHACPECYQDGTCRQVCAHEPDLDDKGKSFGSHAPCDDCRGAGEPRGEPRMPIRKILAGGLEELEMAASMASRVASGDLVNLLEMNRQGYHYRDPQGPTGPDEWRQMFAIVVLEMELSRAEGVLCE